MSDPRSPKKSDSPFTMPEKYPFLPLWTDTAIAESVQLGLTLHGFLIRLRCVLWHIPGGLAQRGPWLAQRMAMPQQAVDQAVNELVNFGIIRQDNEHVWDDWIIATREKTAGLIRRSVDRKNNAARKAKAASETAGPLKSLGSVGTLIPTPTPTPKPIPKSPLNPVSDLIPRDRLDEDDPNAPF